jgi:hypothetical protein
MSTLHRTAVSLVLMAGAAIQGGTTTSAGAAADSETNVGAARNNAAFCSTAAVRAPAARHARRPLSFEINRGQSTPDVKFVARDRGVGVFLTSSEAVFVLAATPSSTAIVRMSFAAANTQAEISGVDLLPGKANYFSGSDPALWRTNVPTYAKVRYAGIYPGIDLLYHGTRPSGDPRQIALRFDGVRHVAAGPEGDLALSTAAGEIRHRRPVMYQVGEGGVRLPVAGRYRVNSDEDVGFEVGAYDTSRPLIIDPVIAFSTYLGGSGFDGAESVAVDAIGHAYVTGATASVDFPVTTGPPPTTQTSTFVTKFSPDGGTLLYSTVLAGGTSHDIAVDSAGRAFITGVASGDFPLFNPIKSVNQEGEVFVAQLTADGSGFVYSTYLGGTLNETGEGIAVDAAGSAYVTGFARSFDFPVTPGAFQSNFAGGQIDAFVAKLSPGGTAIAFSTYLGGGLIDPFADESGMGIAVDASGVYVTGWTGSDDFPVFNAFQPTHGSTSTNRRNAFVTKLTPDGTALVYSTYLGGTLFSRGEDIAIDAAGRAFVVGSNSGPNFPTVGAFQLPFGEGFVSVFTPNGQQLAYSTTFPALPASNAVDSAGNIFVTGAIDPTSPGAASFPVMNAVQSTPAGGTDGFVTKFNAALSGLVYSTYLGGEANDRAAGIAVDKAGSAYVAGRTSSNGFPLVNPYQASRVGTPSDAFVTKLTEFDLCLQDDHTGHVLQINTATGGYQFLACGQDISRVGRGTVTQLRHLLLLHDIGLVALIALPTHTAFASIVVPGAGVFAVADSDTTNNTCSCP